MHCDFVFVTKKVCMESMVFLSETNCHLGIFFERNDNTLWGYKEKHIFYPIDKSQTKEFNDGSRWGIPKIEYKSKTYSRGE